MWGFFIQAKAYPVRFQLKSNSVFMLCAKLLTKCIEVFDSHSRSPLRYNVKISGLLCLRPRISNASQLSNNAMSWPHSAGKHGDYVPFMAINIKWNATRLARTYLKNVIATQCTKNETVINVRDGHFFLLWPPANKRNCKRVSK